MWKKYTDYMLGCSYLPSKVRDYLPWDTDFYALSPEERAHKKRQSMPLCKHCGLCMTGSVCPLEEKHPMEK